MLPAVFFLGLATYVRVLQRSIEDIIYARAINGSATTTPRSTAPGPTTSCSRAATTTSGTAILALHVAYQVRRFASMRAGVAAAFPSARPRPRLVPGPGTR